MTKTKTKFTVDERLQVAFALDSIDAKCELFTFENEPLHEGLENALVDRIAELDKRSAILSKFAPVAHELALEDRVNTKSALSKIREISK